MPKRKRLSFRRTFRGKKRFNEDKQKREIFKFFVLKNYKS